MSRNPAEDRRIDSWKEIAAFFGRDERTVKRWEKERGLPIHRLPGERGGVFAWSQELTQWLNSSSAAKLDPEPAPSAAPAPPSKIEPAQDSPPAAVSILPRAAMLSIAALVLALAALSLYAFRFRHHSARAASSRTAATLHAPDAEAEQFYLKGRYYWSRRTEADLRQAIDAFTQAVVHDSEYAKAYAGLAECYDLMPEFSSMPRSEAFPRAIAAATKAVALDDSLAEAHRSLAFALFYWDWNVNRAFAEYQRAIQLDPRDEEAHHWYATSLFTLGRDQEALVEIGKAQELNPANRSILSDQALIRYWAGQPAAAIDKLREIERAEPDFLSAPRYLAGLAFAQKNYRVYIAQIRRLATLSHDEQLAALADAAQRGLAQEGEHGMLEAMRLVQQQAFDAGQASGFDLARTCTSLGRTDEAVIALKAAFANHDYMVMTLATDPSFAALRGNPGFEDLKHQVAARMYRPA